MSEAEKLQDKNGKLNPEARRLYEERLKVWQKRLEKQIESCRESERLTAEDYNIRINCVAE